MRFQEIKNILTTKTVGIAGAGGLGSNCAESLVRLGIGKIIIADFDIVSESNLNRQFYFRDQIGQKKVFALKENLSRISEKTQIEAYDQKLNSENIPEIFAKCEIIVEAFDLAEQKKMIIENILENFPDKIIISASGMAGFGNIQEIKITEPIENIVLCGDFQSEVSDENPPIAPKVKIVANMQADAIICKLIGKNLF